jgi:hypothetical protein
MQNHLVKKAKTLLYNTHENDKEIGDEYNLCLNILKIYVTIRDTVFFAAKNKVNSMPSPFMVFQNNNR